MGVSFFILSTRRRPDDSPWRELVENLAMRVLWSRAAASGGIMVKGLHGLSHKTHDKLANGLHKKLRECNANRTLVGRSKRASNKSCATAYEDASKRRL